MDKPRPCGCKGKRTCLSCEGEYGLQHDDISDIQREKSYVFCPWCQKAWPGWDMDLYRHHPNHEGQPIDYSGIFIQMDWLSEEEEMSLIKGMDEMPWDISQSGRRKQNFGPKCNFKKRKMKLGDFNGFPAFSKFVQDKFKEVPILEGYLTIEQCSLEYDPSKGASIDKHIDDCWVWGERIITVNLLSDSVLTMTPYRGEEWRYNLPLVSTYDRVLDDCGVVMNNQIKAIGKGEKIMDNISGQDCTRRSGPADVVVRIPMPRRSLLVIYGSPRYDWEHRVLREDVHDRRLCLAYREFTPPFLPGGKQFSESEIVLQTGNNFWDHLQT
ncbi:hypothetical protein FOCC_FOCC008574 [Frankliniella occidentalis]|uniref:Alpha-ketoglutarate-dependent dioxygenase alkB homolog 4 isoform X2 n=1 Tax=Frankliniella occidentalis TaxID=133901 RepID=A0A6J1T6C9_FRAOC|nr:alpha-ketoglutarate-dependent dioxygenase alkB homolog 4 isoform X2 [Frankliniella occidentalis]KAE8744758.1 hypothetical protein FOCC_FOCC008574 [Frankliniella occidentalis]